MATSSYHDKLRIAVAQLDGAIELGHELRAPAATWRRLWYGVLRFIASDDRGAKALEDEIVEPRGMALTSTVDGAATLMREVATNPEVDQSVRAEVNRAWTLLADTTPVAILSRTRAAALEQGARSAREILRTVLARTPAA